MARIDYYIHGRGSGHATRSAAIVSRLRGAGHEVHVLAGRDAFAMFAEDPTAEQIESLMPDGGVRLAPLLARRVKQARARPRPDAVISDGDLPGVIAARSQSVASIAVGHGLIFSHCHRPEGFAAAPWRREALKGGAAALGTARQVAVNFAPLQPRSPSTIVARPTLRAGLGPRDPNPTGVLCYLDAVDGRRLLQPLVARAMQPLVFAREDPEIEGVRYHPIDASAFTAALRKAQCVISAAGSQLISECVALGVPQFAIHPRGHDEQRLNVAMLRHFGLGDGCQEGEGAEQALTTFLDSLQHPRPPRPGWDAPDAGEAVLSFLDELLRQRSPQPQ